MQTYTDPEQMADALLNLTKGDQIKITLDGTEHVKAEVFTVLGPNTIAIQANPNADFAISVTGENRKMYTIVSRPTNNPNEYNLEVTHFEEDLGPSPTTQQLIEAIETVGTLTKLEIY